MFGRRIKRMYELVERDTELGPFHAVHIKKGDYKGLVYYYGAMRFQEVPELDTLKLKFTFDVIENPKQFNTASPFFEQLAGDILVDILERHPEKTVIVDNLKPPYDDEGIEDFYEE